MTATRRSHEQQEGLEKSKRRWTRWLARWLFLSGYSGGRCKWSQLAPNIQAFFIRDAKRMIAAFDDDVAAMQWLERLATRKDPS